LDYPTPPRAIRYLHESSSTRSHRVLFGHRSHTYLLFIARRYGNPVSKDSSIWWGHYRSVTASTSPCASPFLGRRMGSAGYRRPRRNSLGASCKLRYPEPPLFGIFPISPPRLGRKLRFDTLQLWRSQLKMSHTSREKLDLVNRTKRIVGHLESVLRGLNEDECADVLQRSRCPTRRHQLHHGGTNRGPYPQPHAWDSKSSEEAAEDVIEIVKSYLKRCKSTRRLRAEGTDTHRYFWRASSREQSLFER